VTRDDRNYALYPHVGEAEPAYGLKLQKLKEGVAETRREVATTLGLEELLDREPARLRGQRQRWRTRDRAGPRRF
jgi:ABC-type sugar transport system ATPase subunit